MKQAGGLVHCELKKGRPTLTQVQIGTKGALMSCCSSQLLGTAAPARSSRSFTGYFSKGAIKSLIGILLEFASYQPLSNLRIPPYSHQPLYRA